MVRFTASACGSRLCRGSFFLSEHRLCPGLNYRQYIHYVSSYLLPSCFMWYHFRMGKYKGFTLARQKANDKYMSEKIDSISVYVPKGQKDIIKSAAASAGISMNQYIVEAINDRLQKESDT